MHLNTRRLQHGLSLVEVFVALLVLSVGLIALAKLQVDLVRSSADSRTRSVAIALAEEKIEDLRSFSVIDSLDLWSPTVSSLAWDHIATNEGGRLPSSSALQVAGIQFTRTWTSSAPLMLPLTTAGPYKDVEVTIAWQNANGSNQEVRLSGTIAAANPADVVLNAQDFNSQPGPRVHYTPGSAPETISVPIDISGNKRRETTKPLPDVSVGGGDYHEVRFDVVNYSIEGGGTFADKREEFATVNCQCRLAGPGTGRTPARISFKNGVVGDEPGAITPKDETGTSASPQNPDLCVICCRDHHDGPGAADVFNPDQPTPHSHYLNGVAAGAGDLYDEACRLKRINGIFQVFEDWQLKALTVAQDQFFQADTGAGPGSYSAYVESFAGGNQSAAKPVVRDLTINQGASAQLLGRAIYIDRMPQTLIDVVASLPAAEQLAYIPFYEVNLTKLADWSLNTTSGASASNASPCPPSNDSTMVLCVTNQAIVDEGLSENNYSRGKAVGGHATIGGSNRVLETANTSNTGVTGTAAVSPEASTTLSDYVTVTVNVGTTVGGVQGEISFCSITGNGATARKDALYSALSVSNSPTAGGSCAKSRSGNNMSYSCSGITTGSTVTVNLAFSPLGTNNATLASGPVNSTTIGTTVGPGPNFTICDQ